MRLPLGRRTKGSVHSHALNGTLHSKRVSIIAGGVLEERKRREIANGERPRIDVLELQVRHHARLHDFRALEDGRGRWLARRTGMWSASLAYRALAGLRHDDVIYATGEDVGLPLALMLRATRAHPRLVVRMEQPTYGSTRARRLAFEAYLRAALPRIDMILCRTEAHVGYLRWRFGVPAERLTFVPETTDAAFFSPGSERNEEAARAVPEEPYIVSAGLELRDYETLIEAVRVLPLRLVIGAGSPWSHSRFAGEELPENVTVASFAPLEMRELYRGAAFVVVPVRPTLRACGMNVVLEAWAMEKGVIATRTKGIVSYAKDGITANLVQPGDANALRGEIERLLERPKEAQALGRAGRALVESELNLDRYLEMVERVLTEVLTA